MHMGVNGRSKSIYEKRSYMQKTEGVRAYYGNDKFGVKKITALVIVPQIFDEQLLKLFNNIYFGCEY